MVKYGVLSAVLLVAVVGAWAFEPWRAFTSSTVDEALPTVAPTSTPAATPSESTPAGSTAPAPTPAETTTETKTETPEPAGPVELSAGDFEDAEYDTSGRARIIELADGSRFVRLEDLDTSDGPDLFVGLSASPSGGDWGSYDDERYVSLGELKATNGNQNYEIPREVKLKGLKSVVIWCDRFNVAFGTAPVSLRG